MPSAVRYVLHTADTALFCAAQLAQACGCQVVSLDYQPDDRTDPSASPNYGAVSPGFPRAFVQVGTDELLLNDSVRFAALLRAAGIPATLQLFDGMPHVFHLFLHAIGAPEGADAYRLIAAFAASGEIG